MCFIELIRMTGNPKLHEERQEMDHFHLDVSGWTSSASLKCITVTRLGNQVYYSSIRTCNSV
jgi:hypothetical protein